MRTTAFASSLPLLGHSSRHENAALSQRAVRPACVAKPPPQKSGSKSDSTSMKRTKRKGKSKRQREGSRVTTSLTAAQISEKISQAVGIPLILEDVARLTKFFHSFTKSKPSTSVNQELQSEVEPNSDSRTRLAVIDDSPSYKPRSATARKIAISYVKTRGAVDRALQAVSIRARSYSKAVARVAGDAVSTILIAGHNAFPGLRLDKAKEAVANVLDVGWTPLSVFQWQLSSGDSKEIEARRKQRMQQISGFLRGARVVSFFTAAGSALAGVGRTVERLAPIAFQGVTKASFGYVEQKQSRKPHTRTLGSAVRSPSQRKRRTQRQETSSQEGVPKHQSFTPSSKGMELLQKAVHPQPTNANLAVKARTATSKSSSGTNHIQRESTFNAETDAPSTSTTGDEVESANETASKQGSGLARTSAIVLATGAVAAATMTVSIPTAITFSTLIVTSMALSGAKAANAVEYQAYGHLSFRQSRSLQNLEGAFTALSKASSKQAKKERTSDTPAAQNIRAQKGWVSKRVSSSLEAGTGIAADTSPRTIETAAYTVSAPQPSILSTPIIGILLSGLDSVAFQIEKLTGTLLRRSSLKYSDFGSKSEWELLRSFQRSFEAD